MGRDDAIKGFQHILQMRPSLTICVSIVEAEMGHINWLNDLFKKYSPTRVGFVCRSFLFPRNQLFAYRIDDIGKSCYFGKHNWMEREGMGWGGEFVPSLKNQLNLVVKKTSFARQCPFGKYWNNGNLSLEHAISSNLQFHLCEREDICGPPMDKIVFSGWGTVEVCVKNFHPNEIPEECVEALWPVQGVIWKFEPFHSFFCQQE